MKNLFLLTLILSFFIPFFKAEAHFLKINNEIGAVLHVDPDDNPIAKQVSTFYLEFKDVTGKFKPKDCTCQITITNISTNKSESIPTSNISYSGENVLLFKYTFPEIGIYSVVIKEQNFTLTYDIRVERESNTPNNEAPSHLFHYLLFGGAIILTLAVVIRDKRREKKV
jgi:hypothetical protein